MEVHISVDAMSYTLSLIRRNAPVQSFLHLKYSVSRLMPLSCSGLSNGFVNDISMASTAQFSQGESMSCLHFLIFLYLISYCVLKSICGDRGVQYIFHGWTIKWRSVYIYPCVTLFTFRKYSPLRKPWGFGQGAWTSQVEIYENLIRSITLKQYTD